MSDVSDLQQQLAAAQAEILRLRSLAGRLAGLVDSDDWEYIEQEMSEMVERDPWLKEYLDGGEERG